MAEESITPEVAEAPPSDAVPPQTAPTAQVAPEPATPEPAAVAFGDPVSVWPFVGYVAVWGVFAAVVAWQLMGVPAEQAVFDSEIYPYTVMGGMTLAFAGPLLVLATWLSVRRTGAPRGTVFASALAKGSVAMLAGVSLWWAALIIVDQVRLGRIL